MADWIIQLIEQGGYWGIALLMFIENVFPPIPSELIMGAGGISVARGTMEFWPLLIAGTIGSTLGNYLWFLVGDRWGYHRLEPFVRASQNSIAYRRGFSHALHRGSASLECRDCHRIMGAQQRKDVTAPIPLNHHAPARSFSCSSCHNGQKAFGGDDFSACTRCHKGQGWRF